MGRPVDAATAFVDEGGSLNVVGGKGDVFVYDPAQNEEGPQSFGSVWVRGEAIYAIDSGKKCWAYSFVDGSWKAGQTLDAADDQAEEAWKAMGNIATPPPAPATPPEPPA